MSSKGQRYPHKSKKRDKVEVKNKAYEYYDWIELSSSRDTLKKLTVKELEKYLTFHKLSLKGLKIDKITWIMAHVNFSTNGSNMHSQYKSVSQNDQQRKEIVKMMIKTVKMIVRTKYLLFLEVTLKIKIPIKKVKTSLMI